MEPSAGSLQGLLCKLVSAARTYLAIPTSLVSHTGFAVDHNVGVRELDVTGRRRPHGPRVVRVGRGLEREVAQHHEAGLAGLERRWKEGEKLVSCCLCWG